VGVRRLALALPGDPYRWNGVSARRRAFGGLDRDARRGYKDSMSEEKIV
jgi:hypothetical protein